MSGNKLKLGSATFTTRARTVDHLGREQIADSPTAVSELWKNSWDAYARNVNLRIYDGDLPVAVLTDDGHGMSEEDFLGKWLVIGTENKDVDQQPTPRIDRKGLNFRPRQGQKGIGRLSSAKLGPLLLLVTQYRDEPFLAALIDWRLFENPYLFLGDTTVATGRFSGANDIFDALPEMAQELAVGVVANPSKWRERNVERRPEWANYDESWSKSSGEGLPPSSRILESLKHIPFGPLHLSGWDGSGTAILVSELDDDIAAVSLSGETDLARENSRTRFRQTLSSFVDPYGPADERPLFNYSVHAHPRDELVPREFLSDATGIDRAQVAEMEHQIEGHVAADGTFRGRVRAFGNLITDEAVFTPPDNLRISDRAASKVGPFDIFISSMEFIRGNSSHPDSEHQRFMDLAETYAGLLIFRDGLRVLPYGREDNDFLEIEFRRSLNAGRYFWNHRQMFGRIALTRSGNPNLRDKAGREGFIDNTAAKTFKELVVNILNQSARRYFGSSSEIRKPRIAEINESRAAARAAADRKKLQARERKLFQTELDFAEETVPGLLDEIRAGSESIHIENDKDVAEISARISGWKDALTSVAVRELPSGLSRLRQRSDAIRNELANAEHALARFEQDFQDAVIHYTPRDPKETLAEHVRKAVLAVRRQIDEFKSRIQSLQRNQFGTVKELADRRVQEFRKEAGAVADRHAADTIEFADAVDAVTELRDSWTSDNRDIFGVYISALEAVKEQIDLETLASVQVQNLREANAELDRLTALAQLGIAVEIAAHDLSDFDAMISSGLHALPDEILDMKAVQDIRLGVDGLTDQLRFLSPLRLSGDKIPRWIDGAEIERFMREFFAPALARSGIAFDASEAFRAMRVFERPARVFPVFMNLINNSIYWVATGKRDNRSILLDLSGPDVVVADSGPGVAKEDVPQIFNLFFTRKQRSGRGVGLYLARANLAAGGHSIRYRTEEDDLPFDGAAFLIGFRGTEAGGNPET